MKKLDSLWIYSWVKRNTSGVPFLLWALGGFSVAVFVVFFRQKEFFNFGKLVYILAFSTFWFLFSDIIKKKEVFNTRLHFLFDSVFYLFLFGSIVFLTGGMQGGLFFILFLATISAPLFGNMFDTIFFTTMLVFTALGVFIFTSPRPIDSYQLGLVLLQGLLFFVVAGTLKFFLIRIIEKEKERSALLEFEVLSRTKELSEKIQELEKFKELTVNRELRMIELKKELADLKGEVGKEN